MSNYKYKCVVRQNLWLESKTWHNYLKQKNCFSRIKNWLSIFNYISLPTNWTFLISFIMRNSPLHWMKSQNYFKIKRNIIVKLLSLIEAVCDTSRSSKYPTWKKFCLALVWAAVYCQCRRNEFHLTRSLQCGQADARSVDGP